MNEAKQHGDPMSVTLDDVKMAARPYSFLDLTLVQDNAAPKLKRRRTTSAASKKKKTVQSQDLKQAIEEAQSTAVAVTTEVIEDDDEYD